MGRGFLGYALALAIIAALVGVHSLQLQHNHDIVATRVAMLEHQAITNKASAIDATFCQVTDHAEWEKELQSHDIELECGDIGPDYYRRSGGKCDWQQVVKPMPGGRYVAGGEHYGIKALITVGGSTGVHVIRSGTTCAAR